MKKKKPGSKALDLHFKINHTGGDYNSKAASLGSLIGLTMPHSALLSGLTK